MRAQGLAALEEELRAEGCQPGDPAFASRLLRLQVERCQVAKNMVDCRACGYFDHCEIAKAHLIDVKYNTTRADTPTLVVSERLPDWLFPAELKTK